MPVTGWAEVSTTTLGSGAGVVTAVRVTPVKAAVPRTVMNHMPAVGVLMTHCSVAVVVLDRHV
ncbi:hypothetical protein DAT35_27305 [Vitiosangium sp. GDMCC 1.1324]|nr:hypothetical protein DAT35_27305 [Vitiosangium sp. GDMCC 1.1324]